MGSDAAFVLLAAVAGLAAGALLRPLVAWLPYRIEREWHAQFSQFSDAPPGGASRQAPAPLVPLMLAASAAFAACAWRYGAGWQALAVMACLAALVLLAWIDARTTLLPDVITLPLLWAGLLVNLNGAFAPLADAVLGAAGGYLLLWLVFHAYRLVTGREGMGHGDFKLVAAAGAWVGFQALPFLIVGASLMGVAGGLAMRAAGRAEAGQALPFGPYIAVAFGVTLLRAAGPA